MTLLAIDTSTRNIGLAIYDGTRVLFECSWSSPDFHTVELAPAIQRSLHSCQLAASDLTALGLAIGPGSYTGLRIGLALAKGLAFFHDLPLLAVPTLDILVAAQPRENIPLAAILQAGRGRLVVGWYAVEKEQWRAQGRPILTTLDELSAQIRKPTRFCGELFEKERSILGRKRINAHLARPVECVRRPALLAELAWNRFQAGENDLVNGLAPQYIQTHEAIPA
jgi:tRNA threonylcarbamoyladenosine biosynthesis protein TsaB